MPGTPGPASYGRTVIRLTNEVDGEILNRGYSYWPASWIDDSSGYAFVFVGHASGLPRFYQVNLTTGQVTPIGSPVPYLGTAEGWYWDRNGRVMLLEGPRLHRVNPFNPTEDEVVLDVSEKFPGCRLWQAHSSDDGTVHSASVESVTEIGPYIRLGTIIGRNGQLWQFSGPTRGELDESQVSGDGRWVLIKEGNDNRLIELASGAETVITNADGALGHSDNGPDYAVGEDDQRGAMVLMPFANPTQRTVLHETWNMGHVSVQAGRCLLSGKTELCLVPLDGSRQIETLAPHGMVGEGYDHQVFANLDRSGRAAVFVSNQFGRFDAYLLLI